MQKITKEEEKKKKELEKRLNNLNRSAEMTRSQLKSDIAKKKEINYLKRLDCEENLDRSN